MRRLAILLVLTGCSSECGPDPNRECVDYILRLDAWTGREVANCDHPLHELVSEGDQWLCRCRKKTDG